MFVMLLGFETFTPQVNLQNSGGTRKPGAGAEITVKRQLGFKKADFCLINSRFQRFSISAGD